MTASLRINGSHKYAWSTYSAKTSFTYKARITLANNDQVNLNDVFVGKLIHYHP